MDRAQHPSAQPFSDRPYANCRVEKIRLSARQVNPGWIPCRSVRQVGTKVRHRRNVDLLKPGLLPADGSGRGALQHRTEDRDAELESAVSDPAPSDAFRDETRSDDGVRDVALVPGDPEPDGPGEGVGSEA